MLCLMPPHIHSEKSAYPTAKKRHVNQPPLGYAPQTTLCLIFVYTAQNKCQQIYNQFIINKPFNHFPLFII